MQVSKEFPPAFFVSAKAQNYFGRLEWTIMGDNNFSFVSNELNCKYSKLTSISRTTLMKLISDFTKAVEQKVEADLPDSFGLVTDGWRFTSASTHYFAVFAYYQDEKLEGKSFYCSYSSRRYRTRKTVPKVLEIRIHIQIAAAREKFDRPVGRKRTLRQFD